MVIFSVRELNFLRATIGLARGVGVVDQRFARLTISYPNSPIKNHNDQLGKRKLKGHLFPLGQFQIHLSLKIQPKLAKQLELLLLRE